MYAIDEEDQHYKKDSITREEPVRPATPEFDRKEENRPDTPVTSERNDGNEEENFIFEQIKTNVKELDSDGD